MAEASTLPVLIKRLVLLKGPQAHLRRVCRHDLPLQLLQVKLDLQNNKKRTCVHVAERPSEPPRACVYVVTPTAGISRFTAWG